MKPPEESQKDWLDSRIAELDQQSEAWLSDYAKMKEKDPDRGFVATVASHFSMHVKDLKKAQELIEAAREEGRREGWEKAACRAVEILDNGSTDWLWMFKESMNYNPDAFKTP